MLHGRWIFPDVQQSIATRTRTFVKFQGIAMEFGGGCTVPHDRVWIDGRDGGRQTATPTWPRDDGTFGCCAGARGHHATGDDVRPAGNVGTFRRLLALLVPQSNDSGFLNVIDTTINKNQE